MTTKYDVERLRLKTQIEEWNSNRLDLFALSQPNENLEFFGVMRFFYQDDADKVSTKCIRVASTATTRDVMAILVEKFRPDMRMLSSAQYALYEVHVNGEERPLRADELPLLVQLNWGKDDREGRFLLKKENDKTVLPRSGDLSVSIVTSKDNTAALQGSFKRKLSKREKKDLKKKEKEQKSLANVTCEENNVGIAQRLYSELPESSFTRSISNPELVMRKRRQLKLEKKLQQIRSNDGGPDSGGTLKIYGSDINPDVPYKTLLLSVTDNAAQVVRETLEKYGITKEDPFNFCLVQVLVPPDGPDSGKEPKECVLNDDDCPLAILLQHPNSKGTVMFHLRRSANTQKKKALQQQQQSARRLQQQQSALQQQQQSTLQLQQSAPQLHHLMAPLSDRKLNVQPLPASTSQLHQPMPFLLEVDTSGKEVNNGKRCRILPNSTEIGSDRLIKPQSQYIQLPAVDILPRHCIVSNTDSSITVKPLSPNAIIFVNGSRITHTTIIRHGDFLKFGSSYNFVLINPAYVETKLQQQSMPVEVRVSKSPKLSRNSGDLETTFDVDGHVETIVGHIPSGSSGIQEPDDPYGPPGYEPDLLPAMLTYKDEAEDQLLAHVINDVNGAAMQFRLAPAYVLYLTLRSRASWLTRPDLSTLQRDERVNVFASKVVRHINHLIRDNQSNPGALSFWLANASELLHFMKQDVDIGQCSFAAQNQLAETIQMTFSLLIDCFQIELAALMPVFLNPDNDDGRQPQAQRRSSNIGNILQVLTTAMTLLRRCRVNAALTIQLFSQLFHFINIWLFNRVVLEPKLQLCTRVWGNKLRTRLAYVQTWAEKQGLELAADCHLAKVVQMALVLETPKTPSEMQALLRSCDSLNSLQVRALLFNYLSAPGETALSVEVMNRLIEDTEILVDRLLISDGREIVLSESLDLQLPFLLPEDGYSCDYVKGMPPGLTEFIETCVQTGSCRLTLNPNASGKWTVFLMNYEESPTYQNLKAGNVDHQSVGLQKPEVVVVSFNKLKNSIGLSIVAAKGDNQREKAIYVKSVVSGGAADLDGRLESGDQLLEVNGQSLMGVTQEVAAQMMAQAGQLVTLRVAKQGAVYHGLAQLLTQSPPPAEVKSHQKQISTSDDRWRPKSEVLMQYNDEQQQLSPTNVTQLRPLKQQHQARSTPTFSDMESQNSLSSVYQSTISVSQLKSGGQLETTNVNSVSQPSLTMSSKSNRGVPANVVLGSDSHVSVEEQNFRAGHQFEQRPKSEVFERQQSLDNTRTYPQNMHYSADDVNQSSGNTNEIVGQFTEQREPKSMNRSVVASPSRQPGYATQMLFPKSQQQSKSAGQVTAPVKILSTVETFESPAGPPSFSASSPNISGYPAPLQASTAASYPSSVQNAAQIITPHMPTEPGGYVTPISAAANVAIGQHSQYVDAYQPITSAKSNLPVAHFESHEASRPNAVNPAIYAVPNTASGAGRTDLKSQSTVESVPLSAYKSFHATGNYDGDFPPPPSELQLEQLRPSTGYNMKESDMNNTNMPLGPGFADRIQPAYSQQMYPAMSKLTIQAPTKKPPPVAAKPKLFTGSVMSSVDRDDIERKDDSELTPKQLQRQQEIRRLESRPYLTANEQSRLNRLLVEEEFDRRVKEVDDEEADYSEVSGFKQQVLRSSGQQLEQPEDFSYGKIDQQRLLGKPDVTPNLYERSNVQPIRPPLPSGLSYYPSPVDSQKPVLENRLPLDDRNKSLGDTRQLPSQAALSSAFDSLNQPGSSQQDINSYVSRSNGDQLADESNDIAVGRQQQSAALNYGEAPYSSSTFGELKNRSASNSALKQPDSLPTNTKKCVTFNDNMVTEYSFNRSYGSTSSESSFAPQSPADVAETVGFNHGVDKAVFGGDVDASLLYGTQTSYPDKPALPQYYGATGPSSSASLHPNTNNKVDMWPTYGAMAGGSKSGQYPLATVDVRQQQQKNADRQQQTGTTSSA